MDRAKKIFKNSEIYGMIFVVACALITYALVFIVYGDEQAYERMLPLLFQLLRILHLHPRLR